MSQRTVSILHTCPSSSTGFLHSRSPWIVDIFLLLKLKGGRKRKHYLLIQSCTAVTYFPSAVINSASWNGGWGGQIIWLCNMKLPLAVISQSSNNVITSVYCNYGNIFNVLNSSFERSKLMTWENEMAKTKEEKFHKNAELSVSGLSWVDENRLFSCI